MHSSYVKLDVSVKENISSSSTPTPTGKLSQTHILFLYPRSLNVAAKIMTRIYGEGEFEVKKLDDLPRRSLRIGIRSFIYLTRISTPRFYLFKTGNGR